MLIQHPGHRITAQSVNEVSATVLAASFQLFYVVSSVSNARLVAAYDIDFVINSRIP